MAFLFINSTGLSGLTELGLFFGDSSHNQIVVDNSAPVQDDNVMVEISGLGHADILVCLKADSKGKVTLFFEFFIVTIDSEQVFSINVIFTIFF